MHMVLYIIRPTQTGNVELQNKNYLSFLYISRVEKVQFQTLMI